MPFFSIIAAYYQGVTKPEIFQRFLDSLTQQTFKDFEVLIYHDGPLLYEVNCPYGLYYTPVRQNKWGHDLRAIGLKQATGNYILHTNVDNVYDLNALNNIYTKMQELQTDILIAKVVMMGLNHKQGFIWYDNPRDYSKSVTLSGNPPLYGNIDLMQAIIAKRLWDKYGWFSSIEQADGIIYAKICSENKYFCSDIVIGKHY